MRVKVVRPSSSSSSSGSSAVAARLTGSDVRRHLTRNTALVVASAPSFPHGIVDDVEGIARETSKRGIPLVSSPSFPPSFRAFFFFFFFLNTKLTTFFSHSFKLFNCFHPQKSALSTKTTHTHTQKTARRLLPRRLRARVCARGSFGRRLDFFFCFSFLFHGSGEQSPPPEPPLRLLRPRSHLHLRRRPQVWPLAQGHLRPALQGLRESGRRGAAPLGVRRDVGLAGGALREPRGRGLEVRGSSRGCLGVDGVCREGEAFFFFPEVRGEQRTKEKMSFF